MAAKRPISLFRTRFSGARPNRVRHAICALNKYISTVLRPPRQRGMISTMNGKPPAAMPKIEEKDVRGLKYFDQLAPLLDRLHKVGCERDRASNRSLHYDQYCMLILLFFFNPVVKSIRGLQQASELKNVQKKLGCPRTSLGSLSESVTVFDPEPLKEIIGELGEQLQPLGAIHASKTFATSPSSIAPCSPSCRTSPKPR